MITPPILPANLSIVIADLLKNGVKPILVGGAIRDQLLGRDSKDYDIECYSTNAETLVGLLAKHGKVDQVGVSFGVIKLYMGGRDYDFSLPRRENKQGQGHRGFVVEVDPSMSVKEACGRRDYTINAMAWDFSEGKLLDFYGGLDDLDEHLLRHTTEAFAEDPLRVLRGFQFAGRFGMTVSKGTAELCRGLKSEFPTLAKERIWGEWEKWADKSILPGTGLHFLKLTGWADLFPGLEDNWLIGARVTNKTEPRAENRILTRLASLCLWMDKEDVSKFLDTLGAPEVYKKKIPPMVTYRAIPAQHRIRSLFSGPMGEGITPKAVRRLSVNLEPTTINEFIPVLRASHEWEEYGAIELLSELSTKENARNGKVKPILTGKHLIELGVEPGKTMGVVLKAAYEAQIDGKITNIEEGLAFARSL